MKPIVRRAISSLIDHQLQDIEGYIDTLEGTIRREDKLLGERIDRATVRLCDEDKPWFIGDQYADEIDDVTETLPRLMWNGAFVSLLSYLEHELLSLARRDLRVHNGVNPAGLTARQQELRYTKDAVEYWKARGMAFPENGETWKTIRLYQDIRNQVAHEGGLQDNSDRSKAITAFVTARLANGNKTLTIRKVKADTRQELTLTADFCREAVDTVRIFFSELVKLLP